MAGDSYFVGDSYLVRMFRICTWVWYFLNMAGLVVCYVLTEMERKGTIHPMITFHCETNDWMRANLHIVCIGLAALGLLSCILTEVCLLRKLKQDQEEMMTDNSDDMEMKNIKTDE